MQPTQHRFREHSNALSQSMAGFRFPDRRQYIRRIRDSRTFTRVGYRIDFIMKQLPNRQTRQTSQPSRSRTARVIHVSVQPKTWFGKLIAGIVGVAVMLVAFFLSVVAFVVVTGIVVAAVIYFLWATRRVRRTMRNRTIDGEIQTRDLQ